MAGYSPRAGLGGANVDPFAFQFVQTLERLADPVTQYYYVNQGPTFSGPGMFAPIPVYRENALPVYYWRHYRHHARADGPVLRRSY